MIPGVSVSTSVVFSEGSEFPKGKPETVLTFEDLKQPKYSMMNNLREVYKVSNNSVKVTTPWRHSIDFDEGIYYTINEYINRGAKK